MTTPIDTVTFQTKPCLGCHTRSTLTLPRANVEAWRRGAFIQDAFPDLTAPEREHIMTGTHPECWAAMFSPEPTPRPLSALRNPRLAR